MLLRVQAVGGPTPGRAVRRLRERGPPVSTHFDRTKSRLTESLKECQRAVDKHGFCLDAYREVVAGFDRSAGIRKEASVVQAFEYILARQVMSEVSAKSYYEFAAVFGSQLLSLINPVGGTQESVTISMQTQYHHLRAEQAGSKIYEVSSGLSQQLLDTELRGLTSEDCRLPYDSLVLIPPVGSGLRVWNTQTGWHSIECIYVSEDLHDDIRIWRFLLVGVPKTHDLDDALLWFAISLKPNRPLSEALDDEDELIRTSKDYTAEVLPMQKEWRRIFNWVLNVIIYATWPDAEREHVWVSRDARLLWERMQKLPKGKKRDRLKSELGKMNQDKKIVLGRSITINRQSADTDEPATTGTGKPLTLRVRVQGHWKKQFHGPQRALRKLIWIQPYWKGPEDGTLSDAVHRLTNKKEDHP